MEQRDEIQYNHVHGIVLIHDVSEQNKVKKGVRPHAPTGLMHKSIGSLIAGFKSSVTKKINEIRGMPGVPVWQRNYYDHIIRNEESFEKIRQYIINNPRSWEEDQLFVQQSAFNN
jgi:putative transposase